MHNEGLHLSKVPGKFHKAKRQPTYKSIQKSYLILSSFDFRTSGDSATMHKDSLSRATNGVFGFGGLERWNGTVEWNGMECGSNRVLGACAHGIHHLIEWPLFVGFCTTMSLKLLVCGAVSSIVRTMQLLVLYKLDHTVI